MQAALADFIRDGRLRLHLRQMNAKYSRRMAATAEALARHCGHHLDIGRGSGGLQLATWFRDGAIADETVAAALRLHGMGPQAMSRFHLGAPRPGLLFGIARVASEDVDGIAAKLARLLDEHFSAIPATRTAAPKGPGSA
jgi:GntR family transcriptional regulator/MocR family aminotransferase